MWRKFFVDFSEKSALLALAGGAPILIAGPGFDFVRLAFFGRVGFDPFEDFAVTFAGGELFAQFFGVDAGEVEKFLVQRQAYLNSPCLPAITARPLSSMRGKMA